MRLEAAQHQRHLNLCPVITHLYDLSKEKSWAFWFPFLWDSPGISEGGGATSLAGHGAVGAAGPWLCLTDCEDLSYWVLDAATHAGLLLTLGILLDPFL